MCCVRGLSRIRGLTDIILINMCRVRGFPWNRGLGRFQWHMLRRAPTRMRVRIHQTQVWNPKAWHRMCPRMQHTTITRTSCQCSLAAYVVPFLPPLTSHAARPATSARHPTSLSLASSTPRPEGPLCLMTGRSANLPRDTVYPPGPAHCHTSDGPVPALLLTFTTPPLGHPSPRPPLECHGTLKSCSSPFEERRR